MDMVTEEKTVGQRIKRRMRDLGMSRSQLCEEVGIDKGHLSKIINDKLATEKGGFTLKICNHLGIYETIDNDDINVIEPEKSEVLMSALREVWDGRESSARALASLIKAGHRLSMVKGNY